MDPTCAGAPSRPLLFCSSFTPPPRRAPSCRRCSVRVTPARRAFPKRARGHWRMESIAGGSVPNWPEEGAAEVEFFDKTSSIGADPPRATELPLFPLQMVLNPGTPIPLHIFELRYRLLFNRVRDGDSKFGIVFYDPESAELASIGCAAELTRFDAMPDGRIMTNNIGRKRFKIVRIIDEKPYTRAMVEFLTDDAPTEDLSPLMEEVWQTLRDVLRLSNKLYDKVLDLSSEIKRLAPGGEADKEAAAKGEADAGGSETEGEKVPEGWPTPRRVEEFSFAVCQVLDMPLKEQQILLQICDSGARLRRQHKMLQTARQYLAAQVTIKEAGLGKW